MKSKGFVLPVPLMVLAVLIAGGAAFVFYSGDSGNREDAQHTLKQKLSSADTEAPKEKATPAPSLAPKSSTQPVNTGYSYSTQRPGWEILTEKEKAQLPACGSVLMTVPPVPLSAITSIEPIGSANPPEHTLASISSDTYIAVEGQGTTATTPLVAPGDMWIILIQPRYGVTQDPEDHVIKYAFCKDVYGVVDHVKSFSPEMQKLVAAYQCQYGGTPGDSQCPIMLLEPVKAGTPLGTVGRMQGNFNFGTWDLRVTNNFVNPSRHGLLTKHSTCPFDYFAAPLKTALMAKLDGPSCGSVEHDVLGTLAGDWFIGDASPTRHADWGKLLHFGTDNRFADQSVISASGIFISQPTKWVFPAATSGTVDRRFKDVTADGTMYCYDNNGNHPYKSYEKGVRSGKILARLTSKSELKVEHQEGECQGGNWTFKNPTVYIR
ncbi:MAG: hypothetical protein Q8P36_00285 [bacterium]|nr:hypothetical protein [bacterium]